MEDVEDLPEQCPHCGNRPTDNCCWYTQKQTLKARIAVLEEALPDPDRLLWISQWLDKAYAVVSAFADHHDNACRERDLDPAACGDLNPTGERAKLLEFMDSKVQDDLRETARKIKEVQARGQGTEG